MHYCSIKKKKSFTTAAHASQETWATPEYRAPSSKEMPLQSELSLEEQ